jgi:hypothetical protein
LANKNKIKMNNVSFYNESSLAHTEKKFFEKYSVNQTYSPIYNQISNIKEMKKDISLKKSISDLSNQVNNNVKKGITEVNIWKKIINKPKKGEKEMNKEINSVHFKFNKDKLIKKPNVVLIIDDHNTGYDKIISTNKNNFNKMNLINEKALSFFCFPKIEKKLEFPQNFLPFLKDKKADTDNQNHLDINLLHNNKDDTKKTKLKLSKRGPYKKKLRYNTINFSDKCFPFKTGKGIINITTKFNKSEEKVIPENKDISLQEVSFDKIEKINEESSNLNMYLNSKNSTISTTENDLYLMKFVTRKYYYSENGKRKAVKKSRKNKPDIIRKKIKSRFHKTLKNIINQNLKKAGSKMFFDCFPQCFIGNITKLINSKCFDLTYKDLIKTDFSSELINYTHTTMDKTKFNKNLQVLDYLEKNPEISENSGFNKLKNLKYVEILKRYFISAEFEDSLNQLKKEKESQEYIQSYIYRGKNYVNFYTKFICNKNNKGLKEKENVEVNENEEEYEDESINDKND